MLIYPGRIFDFLLLFQRIPYYNTLLLVSVKWHKFRGVLWLADSVDNIRWSIHMGCANIAAILLPLHYQFLDMSDKEV